jgi:hypothetical protein
MTSLPPAHESADDGDGDDEALSWDGESDSSHVAGPKPLREKPVRTKPARAGKPGRASAAADDAATETETDAEPQPTSSVLLVAYGIVAGVYALYTVGWATTILRGSGTMSTLLGEIMFQFGEFLAIAASPLWFASVLFLTRGRRPALRLLWLLAGLLLLVPVPFVMGV